MRKAFPCHNVIMMICLLPSGICSGFWRGRNAWSLAWSFNSNGSRSNAISLGTDTIQLSKEGTGSLAHWGRVTHICVGKLTIIGSDNGLSPERHQAFIWTNAGILLIWPLGTNFNEIPTEIYIFSFKKMHLKMSSANWRPFCIRLNVLTWWYWLGHTPLPQDCESLRLQYIA